MSLQLALACAQQTRNLNPGLPCFNHVAKLAAPYLRKLMNAAHSLAQVPMLGHTLYSFLTRFCSFSQEQAAESEAALHSPGPTGPRAQRGSKAVSPMRSCLRGTLLRTLPPGSSDYYRKGGGDLGAPRARAPCSGLMLCCGHFQTLNNVALSRSVLLGPGALQLDPEGFGAPSPQSAESGADPPVPSHSGGPTVSGLRR